MMMMRSATCRFNDASFLNSILIEREDKDKLNALAAKWNCSVAEVIRLAITKFLNTIN